eukprot:scaffold31406_cov23-Tisochrysis_lutea.AAC.1
MDGLWRPRLPSTTIGWEPGSGFIFGIAAFGLIKRGKQLRAGGRHAARDAGRGASLDCAHGVAAILSPHKPSLHVQ